MSTTVDFKSIFDYAKKRECDSVIIQDAQGHVHFDLYANGVVAGFDTEEDYCILSGAYKYSGLKGVFNQAINNRFTFEGRVEVLHIKDAEIFESYDFVLES